MSNLKRIKFGDVLSILSYVIDITVLASLDLLIHDEYGGREAGQSKIKLPNSQIVEIPL
jgi:hypothetical protein